MVYLILLFCFLPHKTQAILCDEAIGSAGRSGFNFPKTT